MSFTKETKMQTFSTTEQLMIGGRGFSITFENNYTISVQWGAMNYCNNRTFNKPYSATPFSCRDAEVMLMWDGRGVAASEFPRMLRFWREKFDEFGIATHVTPDEVGELIGAVQSELDVPIRKTETV